MTWWLNEVEGRFELRDDDKLVALIYSESVANEILGSHDLITAQGRLLNGVVDAIRGAPPDDVLWSHHDAPELARQMMTHVTRFGVFLGLMSKTMPVYTDSARMMLEDLERFQTELRK